MKPIQKGRSIMLFETCSKCGNGNIDISFDSVNCKDCAQVVYYHSNSDYITSHIKDGILFWNKIQRQRRENELD